MLAFGPEPRQQNERGGAVPFVAVEGAPESACRTSTLPGGRTDFECSVHGRVQAVTDKSFELICQGRTVRLKHLFPGAVRLGPLVGQEVGVSVLQSFEQEALSRVRCLVTEAEGRIVLMSYFGPVSDFPAADELGLDLSLSVVDAGWEAHFGAARWPLRANQPLRLREGDHAYELVVTELEKDPVSAFLLRCD